MISSSPGILNLLGSLCCQTGVGDGVGSRGRKDGTEVEPVPAKGQQPPEASCAGAREDLPQDSKYRYGCSFLKDEVLNRVKPMYHIFGHNHDGYGTKTIDGINFINAASVDEDYQQNHPPLYFELPFRKAESDPNQ